MTSPESEFFPQDTPDRHSPVIVDEFDPKITAILKTAGQGQQLVPILLLPKRPFTPEKTPTTETPHD
jgi:hypothetical protein